MRNTSAAANSGHGSLTAIFNHCVVMAISYLYFSSSCISAVMSSRQMPRCLEAENFGLGLMPAASVFYWLALASEKLPLRRSQPHCFGLALVDMVNG